MTGIIINNNEYTVNTGSTKIEYIGQDDACAYSMWGDNPPTIRRAPEVGTVIFDSYNGSTYRTGVFNFTLPVKGRYGVIAITSGLNSNIVSYNNGSASYTTTGALSGCMHTFEAIVDEGDYIVSIPNTLGSVYYTEPWSKYGNQGGNQRISLWDAPVIITCNSEQVYKLNNQKNPTSNLGFSLYCPADKVDLGYGYIMGGSDRRYLLNAPHCITTYYGANTGEHETIWDISNSNKVSNPATKDSSTYSQYLIGGNSPLTNTRTGPGAGADGNYKSSSRIYNQKHYNTGGYFKITYLGKN